MAVQKVALLTDSHEASYLEAIVKVSEQESVDSTWFFGDGLYRTMSPLTHAEAYTGFTVAHSLLRNTNLSKDATEGLFSQEQLERYANARNLAREVSDTFAEERGRLMKEKLPGFEFGILGNHDRNAVANTWGDAYAPGEVIESAGVKIFGASGGGTPATTAYIDDNLAADSQFEPTGPFEDWQQALVSTPEMNILGMHVPFTFDDDTREDRSGRVALEALRQRAKLAQQHPEIKMPEAIIYGHNHDKARWGFREIKDKDGTVLLETLVGTAGTASFDHNMGPFSSFCIAEVDDNTKRIERVQEYRIWSSPAGLREVEHYGTHEVDYDAKTVKFNEVKRTVLEENDIGTFSQSLDHDPHNELGKKGFNLNYEVLTPMQKDLQVIHNKAMASEYAERVSHDLRRSINWVRHTFLEEKGFSDDYELSDMELRDLMRRVREDVIENLAREDGVSFDSIKNPFTREIFQNVYCQARLGMTAGIFSVGLMQQEDRTIAEFKKNWALEKQLVGHFHKNIEKHYDEMIEEGLEENDFQQMIDLHMPQNAKVKEDLTKDQYRQIYQMASQQGLISSKQVKDMDQLFDMIESYTPNSKTRAQLQEMFHDITVTDVDKVHTTDSLRKEESTIKEAIEQGKVPVFQDDKGDYLPGQNGQRFYLTDDFKNGLDYQATTPEAHLETQKEQLGSRIRAGELPVIRKDGQDYLPSKDGLQEFDPSDFGLSPSDYQATPFEQMRQQHLQNQISEAQQELQGLQTQPGYNMSDGGILMPDQGIVTPGQPAPGVQPLAQPTPSLQNQPGSRTGGIVDPLGNPVSPGLVDPSGNPLGSGRYDPRGL